MRTISDGEELGSIVLHNKLNDPLIVANLESLNRSLHLHN